MHELSLCRSLIRQVQSVAQQRRAHRVVSIAIRVGSLSGVEPALLERAYPIASAGTIAEAADLVIEPSPLRVKCTQCGAESDADINRLLCAQCGDWRTRVVSGDEIFLTSVELETDRATEGQPQHV